MIPRICCFTTVPAIAVALFSFNSAVAQPGGFNYDEAEVPAYTLPDPLVLNGEKVTDAKTWWEKRRPQILEMFETHVYGAAPARPAGLHFELIESSDSALNRKAVRKQVRITFRKGKRNPHADLLIYLPKRGRRSVPVFIGLNFRGNHTVHSDPAVRITTSWVPDDRRTGAKEHRAGEKGRGAYAGRWSIDTILARGYAVATMYAGDIDPDYDDGFRNGVHPLFAAGSGGRPAGNKWGTIAAWAWGLSRAMDYFETDVDIDHKKVAVMGHSRLGKTALWAGARDTRFAIAISNNSGCGGAALSRRRFGETVKRINTSFPHWFCGNFKKFNDNEAALPVDQHMLISLIAPRPVYVASANKDRWADPRGEFLSCRGADAVYRLLGTAGLPAKTLPPLNRPVMGAIGYHIRAGKHDVTEYDWKQYLSFADAHFRGR